MLSLFAIFALPCAARAAERLTLKNGFEVECERREIVDGHLRIYLLHNALLHNAASEPNSALAAGAANFMDVAPDAVVRSEVMSAAELASASQSKPLADLLRAAKTSQQVGSRGSLLSAAEIGQLAAAAGTLRNIDRDLLLSVIHAESGGRALAISRTGARGLMQLMPGTAAAMGVADALRPRDNVEGGTAYLDQMLRRYHDNLALALAAYNAGPGAVDRWHGVPPYRETRAYVARVIGEFNRRKGAEEALAHGR